VTDQYINRVIDCFRPMPNNFNIIRDYALIICSQENEGNLQMWSTGCLNFLKLKYAHMDKVKREIKQCRHFVDKGE